MTHAVREATAGDAGNVIRLLDAAMLEFDRERARERVRGGDALVAVVRGHNREERRESADPSDDRVIGVCVLCRSEGATEIEQIAVHRSRRGRGVGTTLIESAAARTEGPLVAEFRGSVRPFYESLGFEIDATAEGDAESGGDTAAERFRGVLR